MEQELFANRYLLLEQKGRGSFGEVWLARDTQLDMNVAIKIYIALDDRGIEDFKKEYKTAYKLNHPNLLHAYHFDICDRRPFLVMPFCPSSALSLIGECDPDTLWAFISDVSSGLAFLHQMDVVHHDIKPDNILRTEDGTFVITDFGISTKMRSTLRRNSTRSMSESSSGGSLPYMGPEMFSERAESVKATDIWAFGVTLYEMITGNLPFFGQGGVMQRNGAAIPEVSCSDPEIAKLVRACLAKETWDRPTAEAIHAMAEKRTFGADMPATDIRKTVPHAFVNQHFSEDPAEPGKVEPGKVDPEGRPTVPIGKKDPLKPADPDHPSGPDLPPPPAQKPVLKRWQKWAIGAAALLAAVLIIPRLNPERREAKKMYQSYVQLTVSVKDALRDTAIDGATFKKVKDWISQMENMESRYEKYKKDYCKSSGLSVVLDRVMIERWQSLYNQANSEKDPVEKAGLFSEALQFSQDSLTYYLYEEAVKKVNGIRSADLVLLWRGENREDEVTYEYKDGAWVITSENKSIPASKTDYLYAYMELSGFPDVPHTDSFKKQTFYVKIIEPGGTLVRGDSSPAGYSFSDTDTFLSDYDADCNKYWLTGWGNKQRSCYKPGRYKYEVYSGKGRKLLSIPLTFR